MLSYCYPDRSTNPSHTAAVKQSQESKKVSFVACIRRKKKNNRRDSKSHNPINKQHSLASTSERSNVSMHQWPASKFICSSGWRKLSFTSSTLTLQEIRLFLRHSTNLLKFWDYFSQFCVISMRFGCLLQQVGQDSLTFHHMLNLKSQEQCYELIN